MKKEGLRLDDKIGISRNAIAQASRGIGRTTPPTKEQIDILRDEYGISLEKRENPAQILIGKLEILKRFGIDTSKITSDDTIETLARKARIRCNRSR